MTTIAFPRPIRPLPTDLAASKVWLIRRLRREGFVDPLAADLALRPLREHPNARVAALATHTTNEIVAEFCK